jgi:hypothetical protein
MGSMEKQNRAERRRNKFGGGRATEHGGWPTVQPNPVFSGDAPGDAPSDAPGDAPAEEPTTASPDETKPPAKDEATSGVDAAKD